MISPSSDTMAPCRSEPRFSCGRGPGQSPLFARHVPQPNHAVIVTGGEQSAVEVEVQSPNRRRFTPHRANARAGRDAPDSHRAIAMTDRDRVAGRTQGYRQDVRGGANRCELGRSPYSTRESCGSTTTLRASLPRGQARISQRVTVGRARRASGIRPADAPPSE